jgi:PAS domain S-box-containing protein
LKRNRDGLKEEQGVELIEKKLRQAVARLEFLVTSCPAVLYTCKPSGDYSPTFVGGNVRSIFGFESQEFIDDPKFWTNHIHPEDRTRVLTAAVEDHQALEYRFRFKDGSYHWINDEINLVRDAAGNPVEMIGYWSDVTDRKQTEQEVKRLQEYLQLQINRMPIGLIVWNREFRVQSWNPAAEKIFGFTAEEAMGKHPYNLIVPKEAQAQVDDVWRRLLEGDMTAHSVNENLTKGGRTIICQWSNTPLRKADGTTIGVLSMVQDITDRRRMEDRLRFLHEHALRLSTAKGMEEIVQHTLDAMEFGLGHPYVDVRIVKDGWLRCKEPRGMEMVNADLRLDGPGLTVQAANSKKTVRVSDTRTEPCYVDRMGTDWKGAPTMLSELAVPVIVEHETAVVLNVEATQLDAITDDDQTLLETLAAHVASAIIRLRHENELQRYSEHLEELVKERTGKLAESERRYRDLFERSPVSLFEEDFSEVKKYFQNLRDKGIKDLRGHLIGHPDDVAKCASMVKILHVNEAALRLYGASSMNELLGELRRVLTHESLDNFREELVALGEGKTRFESEFDNQTLTGETEHVSLILNVIPGYENTLEKVMASVIDLTERKQMEMEVRESRDRLEHVLATNPAVLSIEEPLPDFSDTYQTYVSESAKFVFGFEPEKFLGESGLSFWRSRLHPDDLNRYWSELPSLWREGKHTFEYRFLNSDGTYRWITEQYRVVRDAEGRISHAVAVAIDATERKKLEERVARAERLAIIGETAAMVGHDLRNPLQGITGAVHLLKEESLTEKERDEMLQLIRDSVHYSDAIVRDLMEYSTEISLEPLETTPRSIVRDSLATVRVPEKITFHDLSEDHPMITVDQNRMRRVIINLIENSIDAMPQGGTLTIRSEQCNGNVVIYVSDTGPGIPEKIMQNLWKPLQTTKAKGLGLGLPISKRIVDAHGGTISVNSKADEGTTVTILLPLNARPLEVKKK